MRILRRTSAGSVLAACLVTLCLLAACSTGVGGSATRDGSGGATAVSAVTSTSSSVTAGTGSVRPFPTATPPGRPSTAGGASAGGSASTGETGWTVTVVRHAERADDGTDDPPLTDAGRERATRLAERLATVPGVGVYATQYQRTQATAAATAETWGVPVTTYDPAGGPQALLAQVEREHPSGAILIVGHSDTVPQIVEALCRCSVDPIAEDDFGNLYQVSVAPDGTVRDMQTLDEY